MREKYNRETLGDIKTLVSVDESTGTLVPLRG